MSFVLAMIRSAAARRRLLDLQPPYQIRMAETVAELEVSGTSNGLLALLVDSCDKHDRSPVQAVGRICQLHPGLPAILWCERHEMHPALLAEAARAGISLVLVRENSILEDVVLQSLVPRGTVSYHERIEAVLHAAVPEPVRALVSFCLHPANAGLSVPAIAAANGIPRRTMTWQLNSVGVIPVNELVTWSRLLSVGWELERESAKSIERIALDHGFGSASALRVAMMRHVHASPVRLRSPGDFEWIVLCFERALRTRRRDRELPFSGPRLKVAVPA